MPLPPITAACSWACSENAELGTRTPGFHPPLLEAESLLSGRAALQSRGARKGWLWPHLDGFSRFFCWTHLPLSRVTCDRSLSAGRERGQSREVSLAAGQCPWGQYAAVPRAAGQAACKKGVQGKETSRMTGSFPCNCRGRGTGHPCPKNSWWLKAQGDGLALGCPCPQRYLPLTFLYLRQHSTLHTRESR